MENVYIHFLTEFSATQNELWHCAGTCEHVCRICFKRTGFYGVLTFTKIPLCFSVSVSVFIPFSLSLPPSSPPSCSNLACSFDDGNVNDDTSLFFCLCVFIPFLLSLPPSFLPSSSNPALYLDDDIVNDDTSFLCFV